LIILQVPREASDEKEERTESTWEPYKYASRLGEPITGMVPSRKLELSALESILHAVNIVGY